MMKLFREWQGYLMKWGKEIDMEWVVNNQGKVKLEVVPLVFLNKRSNHLLKLERLMKKDIKAWWVYKKKEIILKILRLVSNLKNDWIL